MRTTGCALIGKSNMSELAFSGVGLNPHDGLLLNPVAQVKFVHTVAAGYTTGAMFVLGISSYYLLKNRDVAFARRSFAIAAAFGMASILSVLVLGDESGYETGEVQKVKLAAIEAEWQRTAKALALITGEKQRLSNNAALQRSMRHRFPYIDPLHHLQVELVRRWRAGQGDERVQTGIHISINGIAAGLRNTG